jgi:hypothetical protein
MMYFCVGWFHFMRCTGLLGSIFTTYPDSRLYSSIPACLHTVCWSVSPPPLTALFRSPSKFPCRLTSSAMRYSCHEEVVFDRDLHRCCSVRRIAVQWEGSTADRWPSLLPPSYVHCVPAFPLHRNTTHILTSVQ